MATFPDSLGYAGLGRLHTEQMERSERRLTKAWLPQLQELCALDADAVARLQCILDDASFVLRSHDMESAESAIGQMNTRNFPNR